MKAKNRASVSEFKKTSKKNGDLSEFFFSMIEMIAKELKDGIFLEYRFHPTRKWRFDLAWPHKKIAVECDGMVWQAGGGRHNTDTDRDKMNIAALMGWRVLRFSGNQIRSNPIGCIKLIREILDIREV